jgi:septum formation protein
VDETPLNAEQPRDLASRLASAKSEAVKDHAKTKDAFVLTADTVVGCGRRILMKPDDEAAARASLALLSGRAHQVFTGLCLRSPDGTSRTRLVTTRVTFKRLSHAEIDGYLASNEWQGKAGGYAVQGIAGAFVKSISGSYSNVVGLPLFETANLLQGAGYPLSFTPITMA